MSLKDGKNTRDQGPQLPNTWLYRVRRSSSVYNDFIPLNEQNAKKESPFSKLSGKIKEKRKSARTGRIPAAKGGSPAFDFDTVPVRRRPYISGSGAGERSGAAFFIVPAVICGAVLIFSFLFLPTLFEKEIHTVSINDGGREFVADTEAETVGEFLDINGITVGSSDYLETPASAEIEDGTSIIIRRAMDLTVNNGTESTNVTMVAGTVADALDLAGVQTEDGDEIYPAADSYVRPGMTIDYINVETEFRTETKVLGFKEVTVKTDKLLKGDQKITQYGQEGEKEVKYKDTYKNGVLFSSEIVDETVTKKPVDEILSVGTRVPQPKQTSSGGGSSSGGSSSGKKKGSSSSGSSSPSRASTEGAPEDLQSKVDYAVNVSVTAYCSHCDPSGVGSSGVPLSKGSIAADKSVFPYGTRIYVPGYGTGTVVDTGVSGNRLDVYMGDQPDESACNSWGRRSLTVYVLK
ncbi:MAG: G5 domain-containing protein [Christensenellaceae bacterium]|nr:G5 domain-containing protein [Christensenellaceae bacterium]